MSYELHGLKRRLEAVELELRRGVQERQSLSWRIQRLEEALSTLMEGRR